MIVLSYLERNNVIRKHCGNISKLISRWFLLTCKLWMLPLVLNVRYRQGSCSLRANSNQNVTKYVELNVSKKLTFFVVAVERN